MHSQHHSRIALLRKAPGDFSSSLCLSLILFVPMNRRIQSPSENPIQNNLMEKSIQNRWSNIGQVTLRGDRLPKYGCFFEKGPKGGGGGHPKNHIADFLVSKRYILVKFFGKNHCKFRQASTYLLSFAKKSAM